MRREASVREAVASVQPVPADDHAMKAVTEGWERALRVDKRLRTVLTALAVASLASVLLFARGVLLGLPIYVAVCGLRRFLLRRIAATLVLPSDLPALLELCAWPAQGLPRDVARPLADAVAHASIAADERQMAEARARGDLFRTILTSWQGTAHQDVWHAVMLAATRCAVPGLEVPALSVASARLAGLTPAQEAARQYLRQVAHARPAGPPAAAASLAEANEVASAALRSFGRRRQQAARELRMLGPAGAEALVCQLRAAGARWRTVRPVMDSVAIVTICAMVMAMIRLAFGFDTWHYGLDINIALNMLGLGILLTFPVWLLSRVLLRSRAVELLLNTAEPRTAGLLVDALSLEDVQAALAARSALLNLLPQLRASDEALLNAGHHARLRKVLAGNDVWFVLAILKAYEQVGGADDVRAVAALAEGHGVARRNDRLRAAAHECLEALRARTEAERPGRILLRPVTATPDAEATLVRPAGVSDSPREVLLRPHDGPRAD